MGISKKRKVYMVFLSCFISLTTAREKGNRVREY